MTFHLSFHIQCQSNSLKMISRKPCALILTSKPLKKDQQIGFKMISCVKNHPCQNKKFFKKIYLSQSVPGLEYTYDEGGTESSSQKKSQWGGKTLNSFTGGKRWWWCCLDGIFVDINIFFSLIREEHQWHLLTWPCVIGPHLGFSHSFQWGPDP